jgi:hypothetical protein
VLHALGIAGTKDFGPDPGFARTSDFIGFIPEQQKV